MMTTVLFTNFTTIRRQCKTMSKYIVVIHNMYNKSVEHFIRGCL